MRSFIFVNQLYSIIYTDLSSTCAVSRRRRDQHTLIISGLRGTIRPPEGSR